MSLVRDMGVVFSEIVNFSLYAKTISKKLNVISQNYNV